MNPVIKIGIIFIVAHLLLVEALATVLDSCDDGGNAQVFSCIKNGMRFSLLPELSLIGLGYEARTSMMTQCMIRY